MPPMTVENTDVNSNVGKTEDATRQREKPLASFAIHHRDTGLGLVVWLLGNRLGRNSRNSGKPPSQDPNRGKKKRTVGERKPGGQRGHIGTTWNQSESSFMSE